MPTTARGYPYPALSDPANGPVALQNLAQALDADVTAVNTLNTNVGAALLRPSAAQSIPAATLTVVNLNANDYLYPGITVASNVVTIGVTGMYAIAATLNLPFGFSAPSRCLVRVERFTTEAVGSGTVIVGADLYSRYPAFTASHVGKLLTAGDKLRLIAFHENTAASQLAHVDASNGPGTSLCLRRVK